MTKPWRFSARPVDVVDDGDGRLVRRWDVVLVTVTETATGRSTREQVVQSELRTRADARKAARKLTASSNEIWAARIFVRGERLTVGHKTDPKARRGKPKRHLSVPAICAASTTWMP